MRTARETKIVENLNGQFCGLWLNADFVAEHEQGIKGIQKLLNCLHPNLLGIERRTCKDVKQENVTIFKNKDNWCLLVASPYSHKWIIDTKNTYNHSKWDNKEFLIVSNDKDKLELLRSEIFNNNVAVFCSGMGIFNNGGLSIVIVSRMDKEHLNKMKEGDEDRKRLEDASAAIGIKEKIDRINERYYNMEIGYEPPYGYFSLKPAWSNKGNASKYKVMYWLNPMQQDKNNYGWFTVEELEEWIHQKGPIVKMEK